MGVAPDDAIVEVQRVRPRARRRAGFTLVELMVVVAIMMVVAAMVMPSLTAVMADNRQSRVAVDLVRLSRAARALATRTRAAHLLRFQQSAQGGVGQIDLYSGLNNRCALTNWLTQAFTNHTPVESWTPNAFNPPGSTMLTKRQVINVRAELPIGTTVTELHICYQPDGQTFVADNTALVPPRPQAGPALFIVRRLVPGEVAQAGVDRHVLFPAGGTARLR